MDDFDFDTKDYVILRHIESSQYYAVTKLNWEAATDLMRINIKDDKSDIVEVEAFMLNRNNEINKFQIVEEISKVPYTSLQGVLILRT